MLLISAPLAAQTKKIVVTGMPPEAVREFQSVSPAVKVVAADRDKLAQEVADADAIFGTINPQLFAAAKKLKWVQVYSAGVESFRFPEFVSSPVVLTNCKIIQGPEHRGSCHGHAAGAYAQPEPDNPRSGPPRSGGAGSTSRSSCTARRRWWWAWAASGRRSRSARMRSA